ncbi:5-oxoprolinase subunit C family protein [Algoriphagus marinus]|uniref:5-oxoprolinase subunit C family protein n=1 Tax=Algoriphagus marinus TaxID=1925762 RepID=UPI00094BB0E8|nr:biotin-dependent carboxyltransferase family protein [Algoriphagus marinus]
MIKDVGFLEILKTNPGTSVQDHGRIGLGKWGIPISGVMDRRSYSWINHLLKNDSSAAVIEILQPGFRCRFDSYTTIGVAGANAEIRKNGDLIPSAIIRIQPDDELEIGKFLTGSIVYLGIAHGFQTERVLTSRSLYSGITLSKMLAKGDKIPFFTNQSFGKSTFSSAKKNMIWFENEVLEVYPGPDFEELSTETQNQLLDTKFTISTLANRMAFQLEELLPNNISERLTAPVYPGTIQLTSGGKMIILMRDAQVTGGYPRILQVAEDALSIVAQKKVGQKIQFQLKNLPKIE